MTSHGIGWITKGLAPLRALLGWSARRRERAQQRRWLMEMNDRLLKDIGLSRADIIRLYGRKKTASAHEKNLYDVSDAPGSSRVLNPMEVESNSKPAGTCCQR